MSNLPSHEPGYSKEELFIISQLTGITLVHVSFRDDSILPALMGYLGEQTAMVEAAKKKVTEMKFGDVDVLLKSDEEYQVLFLMVSENMSQEDIKNVLAEIHKKFKKTFTTDDLLSYTGDIRQFTSFGEEIKILFQKPVDRSAKDRQVFALDRVIIPQTEEVFLKELMKLTKKPLLMSHIIIQKNHIVEMNLANFKLKNLPVSIKKLTELHSLNLMDNKIKSLPATFNELEKLENLNLNNNRFTSLPGVIGLLPNLKNLAGLSNPWDSDSKGIFNNSLPVIQDFCRRKASLWVFLSHAEADFYSKNVKIKKIAELLESKPEIYKSYYSEQDLQGNFEQFMKKNVPKSQILIFFTTKKSLESDPCRLELQLALDNNLHIIPILADGLQWSDLDNIQLYDKMGNHFFLSGEKGLPYQKRTSKFTEALTKYIYKLKRNIDLFDETQKNIDKFHLNFVDEINLYLKSHEYHEKLSSINEIVFENYSKYRSKIIDKETYFETIFRVLRNSKI